MGTQKGCECSSQILLCANRGRLGTFYFTYENNNEKVYRGIIETACCSHFVISDPQTGMRYLLLYKYLDYATFDEEIEIPNDCC